MWKIYVLERIKDGGGWRAGAVIHAHSRCKGRPQGRRPEMTARTEAYDAGK